MRREDGGTWDINIGGQADTTEECWGHTEKGQLGRLEGGDFTQAKGEALHESQACKFFVHSFIHVLIH